MRLLTILVFTALVVAVIDAKAARANEETEEVAANDNPNSSQNVDYIEDPRENAQPQPEAHSETNQNENHEQFKRRLSSYAIQQLENAKNHD